MHRAFLATLVKVQLGSFLGHSLPSSTYLHFSFQNQASTLGRRVQQISVHWVGKVGTVIEALRRKDKLMLNLRFSDESSSIFHRWADREQAQNQVADIYQLTQPTRDCWFPREIPGCSPASPCPRPLLPPLAACLQLYLLKKEEYLMGWSKSKGI